MVKCDYCNTEFKIKLKTKKYKKGIEENYFICPECNNRYVSYCTNQKIRKDQVEINRMKDNLAKNMNNISAEEYIKAANNIKNKRDDILKDMKELKEDVIKRFHS